MKKLVMNERLQVFGPVSPTTFDGDYEVFLNPQFNKDSKDKDFRALDRRMKRQNKVALLFFTGAYDTIPKIPVSNYLAVWWLEEKETGEFLMNHIMKRIKEYYEEKA